MLTLFIVLRVNGEMFYIFYVGVLLNTFEFFITFHVAAKMIADFWPSVTGKVGVALGYGLALKIGVRSRMDSTRLFCRGGTKPEVVFTSLFTDGLRK